jgi:hypothetical protein
MYCCSGQKQAEMPLAAFGLDAPPGQRWHCALMAGLNKPAAHGVHICTKRRDPYTSCTALSTGK